MCVHLLYKIFFEQFRAELKFAFSFQLINVKEASKRTKVSANELANDDTSLVPEMLHASNLIKEESLLEVSWIAFVVFMLLIIHPFCGIKSRKLSKIVNGHF